MRPAAAWSTPSWSPTGCASADLPTPATEPFATRALRREDRRVPTPAAPHGDEPPTAGPEYARRLQTLSGARWKRVLDVQAPYRAPLSVWSRRAYSGPAVGGSSPCGAAGVGTRRSSRRRAREANGSVAGGGRSADAYLVGDQLGVDHAAAGRIVVVRCAEHDRAVQGVDAQDHAEDVGERRPGIDRFNEHPSAGAGPSVGLQQLRCPPVEVAVDDDLCSLP